MAIKNIPLKALVVNRANDRHGELENETAAIAWLFAERETHMKNLAKDIVAEGQVYEIPLVSPEGAKYVVFDGNRRVTCLKLLAEPRRAPTVELQSFFAEQRANWKGKFPEQIQCQIEPDRDRIDDILLRRHTGSQNGVGQSPWDDRMKSTFVARTGKGGPSVADEIEKRLAALKMLPTRRKLPRSTMNRLLSAEPFRNRLGISVVKGKFEFTHKEEKVLSALARVADDMANRRVVLGHLWDVDGKNAYLDKLEAEGVLPSDKEAIAILKGGSAKAKPAKAKPTAKAAPTIQTTLIPQVEYGLSWPGRLQRHHQIWEELQFHLLLAKHPNAISVLFRVLLELSVENYLGQTGLAVQGNDKLAARMVKIGKDLQAKGKLDAKGVGVLAKFQQSDKLVSADTLNRYVHSSNFAPSPDHLISMWNSLSNFVVLCLKT